MPGGILDRDKVRDALLRLLPRVTKPTRYLGGEVNSRVKDQGRVRVRMALAFPDVYEIGMSHLGLRILYGLLNDIDGVAAERVFMPWTDMLGLLREQRLPLTTLETTTPLSESDLVGFSLQHELTFTNVLAMLELGGIPLLAAERGEDDPLVLGGGPAVFNPEPVAPVFDLILAGDGEEALPEFIALYERLRSAGAGRADILAAAAARDGWYAPGLYETESTPAGFLVPRPREGRGAPARVRRRLVLDLDRHPFPERIVVPHTEIVHDRVSFEVMRGCPVGCRFCQAGFVYRPSRGRDADLVVDGVRRSVTATGFDEFSLTSLNSGRYLPLEAVLARLMDDMAGQGVSAGLSSLHATTLTENLVRQVRRVRKTGFTIAPEAGSQRLRDVINKNLTEDQILEAARLAFEAGWTLLKLYFMIGLPTETDDDIDALIQLAGRVAAIGRGIAGPRAKVTLAASTFVPKPFTPFQWLGMERPDVLAARQQRIRRGTPPGVQFRTHHRGASWLEGALSRADRRAAQAILSAYRGGAVLDGWAERLDLDCWRAAFADAGLDADHLGTASLPGDVELPWEVIDPLIRREWLARECERALRGERTEPCGPGECSGCGAFVEHCKREDAAAPRTQSGGTETADLASAGAPAAAAAGGEEPATADAPRRRYRARFEKLGRSRFLGHLDLVRALTMAFRRAGIPLAYSHGFKPRPRLSFSPALSLGVASEAEYVDFETTAPLDIDGALERVNATVPEGLRITALLRADSPADALQDIIRRARYRVRAPGVAPAALADRARDFLSRERWEITRKKDRGERRLNIRPLVAEMDVAEDGALEFSLVLGREMSAKPSEVVTAVLGEHSAEAEILRVEQYAEIGGRLVSPLLAGRRRRFD